MVTVIDELEAAVSALLAIDPDGLTAAELDDAARRWLRVRDRLEAAGSRLVEAWDRRSLWAANGSTCVSRRVMGEVSCSFAEAKRTITRARSLAAMPAVAAAVTAGQISLDQARLLAAADTPEHHEAFVRSEQFLVDRAIGLGFHDTATMLEYWSMYQADVTGDVAADGTDHSTLSVSTTFRGSVVVSGTLDALPGGVVVEELARLERELWLEDQHAGRRRTPRQRRAGALLRMAVRSAAKPAGAVEPRILCTVHVGESTLANLCELAHGAVLAPGVVVPWLNQATIESILFDGPTTVVGVSSQRSFTGVVRRAVQARDRHCVHPSGCRVPASRCDVNHIVPHAHHGPTSQFNGNVECPAHNRHPERHDHATPPLPARSVTAADLRRVRSRYRARLGRFDAQRPSDGPDDDPEDDSRSGRGGHHDPVDTAGMPDSA